MFFDFLDLFLFLNFLEVGGGMRGKCPTHYPNYALDLMVFWFRRTVANEVLVGAAIKAQISFQASIFLFSA